MIAAKFPLTVSDLLWRWQFGPISSCRRRRGTVCFIMGKESATVRRMGVVMACLSKGSKWKRGVEYRGIGRGGVGMVDAGVVGGRVAPEHLVVMVNGIIGSATDGKFAAEQFVDCGEAS